MKGSGKVQALADTAAAIVGWQVECGETCAASVLFAISLGVDGCYVGHDLENIGWVEVVDDDDVFYDILLLDGWETLGPVVEVAPSERHDQRRQGYVRQRNECPTCGMVFDPGYAVSGKVRGFNCEECATKGAEQ